MKALHVGAVMAPPENQTTPAGDEVPAYWELGVGRGSVPQAEAWIVAFEAELLRKGLAAPYEAGE